MPTQAQHQAKRVGVVAVLVSDRKAAVGRVNELLSEFGGMIVGRLGVPYRERNVGVIADNETTFHGVAPLGAPGATMPEGLHSGCHLVRGDGGWDIVDGDRLVSRIDDADARITVSWKAECFADAEAAQRVDDGEDALTLDMVVDRFLDDLAARGIEAERPADPLGDEAFVAVLAAAYPEVAPELVA